MAEFDIDQYTVPPLIKDMILNLRNTKSPLHIRNNYKLMLENIMMACQKELEYFSKAPTTSQPLKRKKPAAKRYF